MTSADTVGPAHPVETLMDTRARTHIQAIAAEIKDTATDGSGTPAMHFTAGMLAGLAAAVETTD